MCTSPCAVFPSWRERLVGSIAALTALVALFSLAGAHLAPAFAQPAEQNASCDCTTAAQRIVTIGMTVADMERSLEFYENVLEFARVSDVEVAGEQYERLQGVFGLRMRICTLQLGDELIELTEYLAPEGRPIPVDSRSNDRWFQHIAIIVSDMDAAYGRLREHGVRHASTGPQTIPEWNVNAAGIKAFYFKDPDNHVLEILEFPPDKGRAKWRQTDRLFLGIDHTAIVVADTDQSIAFYRDLLGMEVAGASENSGTEQEHLNNVFGARLRITSLRCAGDETGPAIELLEYLAPTDGRPSPPDTRANDLWHWQVTLAVIDASASERLLRAARAPLVSPGLVNLDDDPGGILAGVTARDPDGHAVRLAHLRDFAVSAAGDRKAER